MTASEREVDKAERTGSTRSSFQPASSGWRRACQLFPGFAALPTSVLVSLEPYAALVDPPAGPLHPADREAIAAAVVELVAGRPVAGAPVFDLGSTRGAALAGFTTRLIDGPSDLDHADLDRLRRSGFSADEVCAAAETAIGFHVVARLAHAAGPGGTLAGVASPRNAARAMGEARGGTPVRAA